MKTILIIEDHEGYRALLARWLRAAGCQHDMAINFAQAAMLLRHREYDCILLDLGLPDSWYAETLERLKALTTTPIVIMTGNADAVMVADLGRQSGNVILRKGIDDETAETTIRIINTAITQARSISKLAVAAAAVRGLSAGGEI